MYEGADDVGSCLNKRLGSLFFGRQKTFIQCQHPHIIFYFCSIAILISEALTENCGEKRLKSVLDIPIHIEN
jgi:hypothetical protein